MGIRETLNQNPAITTGVTIAIIVAALGVIIWTSMDGGSGDILTQSFYSTDDGQTWFPDEINKIPPFDVDGKPAYRVYVFTCDEGKTKFVSHLERYTDEAKKQLEEMRDAGPEGQPNPGRFEGVFMTGVEVKDPGAKDWIRKADFQRAPQVMQPRCPDGSTTNIKAVFPD